MREPGNERETHTERHRDRQTDRDRDRQTDREKWADLACVQTRGLQRVEVCLEST